MTDKIKTTLVPPHTCQTCKDTNDAVSNMNGLVPNEGAVSICINCGEVTLFNEDLTQRIPNDEEMLDIRTDPAWVQIQAMQIAIRLRGLISENL